MFMTIITFVVEAFLVSVFSITAMAAIVVYATGIGVFLTWLYGRLEVIYKNRKSNRNK